MKNVIIIAGPPRVGGNTEVLVKEFAKGAKESMKRMILMVAAIAADAALAAVCGYVDPFVGTQGNGHCVPNATVPFGLVQAGPASGNFTWDYTGGYQYADRRLYGFHQDAISGTGGKDLGDLLIQPFPAGAATGADFTFEKGAERAEPGYYEVTYPETGVRTRITASEHAAFYRIACPGERRMRLLVDLQWGLVSRDRLPKRVLRCETEVRGSRLMLGRMTTCHWANRRRDWYFALETDRPWIASEPLPKRDPRELADRLVLDFPSVGEGELGVRVALSTVSAEGALANLRAEMPDWDFDRVRAAASARWEDVFRRIRIDADEDMKRTFYTCLYHLCIAPNVMSDVAEPRRRYGTFSIWDTFRAAHPLYTILFPERVPDFVDSIIDMARQPGGYLPVWAYWRCETECMIGTHGVPVVVDAFLKGFPMDAEEAYAAVRQSLTARHRRYKENWDVYDRYGYYPFDVIRGESVSRTLECGYDDACAARMAAALGRADDAAFFRRRSNGWTNVLDRTLGLMRGKDSHGRWREPYDPYALGHGSENDNDFTEGNAFQYTWHVLQDPEGLVAALGGPQAAGARLDAVFADTHALDRGGRVTVDVTGLIGQYVHGNEPSQHMIYLYPYCGLPDRVPERVNEVFAKFYRNAPDGLCGNEDCGQMSAWYVFSALGFYPLDPCGGDYVLGAPHVRAASIALPGGRTFRVMAEELTPESIHVAEILLNGRKVEGRILRHAEVMAGGELKFMMRK